MLFSSPRLVKFFQEELGYPSEMIQVMQEDFFETFLIYLETEINLYFDENNLDEEITALEKTQNNGSAMQVDLIESFLKMYEKYPEIKEKVDKHMSYFTKLFIANIHNRLSPEQIDRMNQIIKEDIKTYEDFRMRLIAEA